MTSQKELFRDLMNNGTLLVTNSQTLTEDLAELKFILAKDLVTSKSSVPKKYLEFIESHLKKQLSLDVEDCYKLITRYFTCEFFGNKDDVKNMLENHQQKTDLANAVTQYYFSEQTFRLLAVRDFLILRCQNKDDIGTDSRKVTYIEQCLSLYKESVKSFCEIANDDLMLQLDHAWSRYVNDWYILAQIMIFASVERNLTLAQLTEMMEICDSIIIELQPLVYKASPRFAQFFEDLLKLFSIVFLENFGLDSIFESVDEQNNLGKASHFVQKESPHALNKFSSLLLRNCASLPIVGLAWFVVRSSSKTISESDEKVGRISLQRNAIELMRKQLISDEISNPIISKIYSRCLFLMLRSLLTKFEVESLFDKTSTLLEILGKLLRTEENGVSFFLDLELNATANVGFNSTFLSLVYNFPNSAAQLFSTLADACHPFSHVKIYNLVSGLNVDEGQRSAVDDLSINGWMFAKTCIAQFLSPMSVYNESGLNEVELIANIVQMVDRLLDCGLSLQPAITQILELLPQLVCNLINSFSCAEFVQVEKTITRSASCLKPLMKIRPELVIDELRQCEIFPKIQSKLFMSGNSPLKWDSIELSRSLFTDTLFPNEIKLGGKFSGTATLFELMELGSISLLECCDNQVEVVKFFIINAQLVTRVILPHICCDPFFRIKSSVSLINQCVKSLLDSLRVLENSRLDIAEIYSAEVCHMVLFTSFGSCLAEILKLGNEFVTLNLNNQLITSTHCGIGTELVSVINNVLELIVHTWNSNQRNEQLTSIEVKLFHESEGLGFKKLVSFIFHQLDCNLPSISCKLLKLFAANANSSLFTFLHDLKEPIRDQFSRVLSKKTENDLLKSAILQVMTCSVESQPALLDFLINMDCATKQLQQPSVLTPILNILFENCDNLGPKSFIPQYFVHIVELVHVLWTESDAQIQVQDYMKSQDKFWESLLKILKCSKDPMNEKIVVCATRVMKISAIELRNLPVGNMQTDHFKMEVTEFLKDGFWFSWFEHAFKIANSLKLKSENASKSFRDAEKSFRVLCNLVSAMRQFLTSILNRTESSKLFRQVDKKEIRKALTLSLEAIQILLEMLREKSDFEDVDHEIELNLTEDIISVWSIIVLNLIQQPDVKTPENLEKICEILRISSILNSFNFYEKFNVSMFSCLTFIMQEESASKIQRDSLVTLMIASANHLLKSTISTVSADGEISPMCDVAISMLSVLFLRVPSVDQFLKQISQLNLISTMISLLKFAANRQGNRSQLASSVLAFFVHLSSYKSSAEFLVKCNMHQELCLTLLNVSRQFDPEAKETYSAKQNGNKNGANASSTDSFNCFSSMMVLSANLLVHAESAYLEQSLDIVSCFEQRIVHNFSALYFNQSEYFLNELLSVLQFIQELSTYMKVWRYKLKDNFDVITKSMATACQTCIALLIRPKYFQYLLTHGSHPSDRRRLSTSESPSMSGDSLARGLSTKKWTPTVDSTPAMSGGSSSLSRQRSLSSTILTTG